MSKETTSSAAKTPTAIKKGASSMTRLAKTIALAATSLVSFAAMSAPAAVAAPNVQGDIGWGPTHLVPGSTNALFSIKGFNVGADPTVGTTTATLELPTGVTLQTPPTVGLPPGVTCNGAIGSATVTCTYANPVPSRGIVPWNAFITVNVAPEPGAAGVHPATLTMSGGGMASPKTTVKQVTISSEPAPFGLDPQSLDAQGYDVNGQVYSQAGGHPFEASASFSVNMKGTDSASEAVKDVITDIPPGFIGDPSATPKCGQAAFKVKTCPVASQVGVAYIELRTPGGNSTPSLVPIYNMVPPENAPAKFGFIVLQNEVKILANLRPGGDYGIRVSSTGIAETLTVVSGKVVLWGVPADPRHDIWRGLQCEGLLNQGVPGQGSCKGGNATAGIVPKPFLSMPTECSNPNLATTIHADSWINPAPNLEDFTQPQWYNQPIPAPQGTNCEAVPFSPAVEMQPSSPEADSPTGLSVGVTIPQSSNPNGLATAHLRHVRVDLPEGMTINAAAADGIEGCSLAQIRLNLPGDVECPQASKVGTGRVDTSLLEEPIQGDVYLATPYDNPFDSLLGIYLVFRGPGFTIKIPGKVESHPVSGKLHVTFLENPQLPFDKVTLDFFGGPRAPLATPQTCGQKTIETELTPWSAPQSGPPVTPTSSYTATAGPAGKSCSSRMASRPFAPKLTAGTDNPLAGSTSPFTLRITRPDGEQELAGLTVKMPRGFSGYLKGIPFCSEAAIAAAQSKTGIAERDNPSCPAASRLGTLLSGAGAGPTPYFVSGSAYLAGPYKGAPLSMVTMTPALAGGTPGNPPVFDLGVVVVRVALHVDRRSAQLNAISDPFPQIIEGIPLRVKDVRVKLDRPGFTLNPTSCVEKSVEATVTGSSGAVANVTERFQVGDCSSLAFKPRLGLKLFGGTKRADHPRFRAVLRPRPGDANASRISVTLPRSAFLDQAHIRTICTRVQFAANACPERSIYGHVTAFTPLLDEPLSGPVYLRSSDNKLPDLVFDLHGIVDFEAVARIDSIRGGIRTTVEDVPDAPIEKVVIDMQGGKKGLIVNSRNLCKHVNKANAKFDAHNGKLHDFRPRVVPTKCGKARKGKR